MDTNLAFEFERALEELCTPARLRAIEAGDADAATRLWKEVDALGFTDALVDAQQGGAGLSLAEAGELLMAAGRAGLPQSFGETMVARALLASAGLHGKAGDSPVALAPAALSSAASSAVSAGGGLECREVSGAKLAGHVLAGHAGEWLLLPVAGAVKEPGHVRPHASASLQWQAGDAVATFSAGAHTTSPHTAARHATALCAIVHAAHMAGTMERVLAMTVGYAGDRRQFGKAISQFQAVQQELAVMAEQAASAVMGARMGCCTGIHAPDPLLAAVAKMRACEAAASVAALAHAVHGAIGVTEELVLGVFTARLHELRGALPGARACAEDLGRAAMASGQGIGAFTITALAPAP